MHPALAVAGREFDIDDCLVFAGRRFFGQIQASAQPLIGANVAESLALGHHATGEDLNAVHVRQGRHWASCRRHQREQNPGSESRAS